MRSRRARCEEGGGNDDKRAQHHLGCDRDPHVRPRARGGGKAIGEYKPIEHGEREQHNEQAELQQCDVAVTGPEQSGQAAHERCYLHDGGSGKQQHRCQPDRCEATAGGRCHLVRQATDRQEQWQQPAKPGTGSQQMQRFRGD